MYPSGTLFAAGANGFSLLYTGQISLRDCIFKKYYTQSEEQEDLISIGTIGLIKGISTFDASKGARLATYAARCVENAILT